MPSHAERGLQPLYAVGETLSGRFRIEQILGSGASGMVYGVHDAHTGRRVALKILWERAREGDPVLERLKRELRAAQQAPNAHCVTVYDLLFVQDHPAILMEWVDGETLRARILGRGALPIEEAAALAEQVLEAAAHLHAVGVVHRDIKSGNVMLAADGTAKLGDFGLAKGEALGGTLTETGVALGTPGYMAPEIIRGGPAGPASDLYSIGTLLFEMLTGRMPYQGSSALEVASRQISESPPLGLLRDHRVPRWLARINARLLERDPADRFSSAREALKAMKSHSAGFAVAGRWRWRAAAAVLLLALGLAAVLWERHAAREAPIHLNFQDKILEARDASGRLLWTRTLPQVIQSAVGGHFGPGGTRAVACAVQWDAASASPFDTNQIVTFTSGGAPLQTLGIAARASGYGNHFRVDLQVHRFSRNDREKLVAYARHTTWYPSVLEVYADDALVHSYLPLGVSDLTFQNSGSMSGYIYRDLDGDGVDEIICAGVNNRLYRLTFAAAVRLDPAASHTDAALTSPDLTWRRDSRMLFYRLFDSVEYGRLALRADLDGPPEIQVAGGHERWVVDRFGLNRDGAPLPPDRTTVESINAKLGNLCSLRDEGRFRDLELACEGLPKTAAQPYAWLGTLFRAHALLGQGRYAESDRLLHAEIARSASGRVPIYAYQFWADDAFLSSAYEECLKRVDQIPRLERMVRCEIGHTALWAAIYRGDPGVRTHVFDNPDLTFFPWYPKMFDGVLKLLDGRPREAEVVLKNLQDGFSEAGDIRLWLVRALLAQGKASEARELYDRSAVACPGTGIKKSLVGVEARCMSGDRDPALVQEADALLANFRKEAVHSVEARAVLPLELAAASRIHRAAGDRAEALKLETEALRLAPKRWKAGLAF